MPERPIDLTLLAEFEQGLNVRRPEKSRIPARKVDRFLHRLIGKEYPYILPEKIVR